MASQPAKQGRQPLLVLISDGRATAGTNADPVTEAEEAAAAVKRAKIDAVVIDAEDGPTRLGLARRLADVMGARYHTVPEQSAGSVAAAIRPS
jgi:magnesium chelatase subunit D